MSGTTFGVMGNEAGEFLHRLITAEYTLLRKYFRTTTASGYGLRKFAPTENIPFLFVLTG
jgi:hypothetical protein